MAARSSDSSHDTGWLTLTSYLSESSGELVSLSGDRSPRAIESVLAFFVLSLQSS